jgi:hypothetical protein
MKRYSSLYLFITLLLLAGYGWLWFILSKENPHSDDLRLCLFHAVTGYPCPSCGTTRSVVFLLNGSFSSAFLTNPLGIPVLIGLVLFPLLLLYDVITRKQLFIRLYKTAEHSLRKPFIAYLSILLVLLNWIWNIKKEL